MTTRNLIDLLLAAKGEAERLGPGARVIVDRLDEALTDARALAVDGGHPDEGARPDQLSSANDG